MERLRFLHIAKTAGSTFTYILYRQYDGKKSFQFNDRFEKDLNRYNALSESEKNNLLLYNGHAPLVTGIKEVDEATIVTMLRDPVERVKSFCQHVSEGKSPYLLETFPPESFNLDRFLESGNTELSNLQTKTLIDWGGKMYPEEIENMTPSEARDAALDTLFNKVFRFGLQEHFDESLMIFSSALNWRQPYYESLNRKDSSKQIQFEDRHIKRITQLNAIDIEVYAQAKERFITELSKVPFVNVKLKWFRLRHAQKKMNRVIAANIKSVMAFLKRVIDFLIRKFTNIFFAK